MRLPRHIRVSEIDLTAVPVPDRRVIAKATAEPPGRSTIIASWHSSKNAGSRMSTSGKNRFRGSHDPDRGQRPAHDLAATRPRADGSGRARSGQDSHARRLVALGISAPATIETIPSLLARDARLNGGWRAEIRNLAEIGYVSTQELIALVRELQGGYRPDIVIFYDGVNDTTSAFLEREAGVTTNEVNRRAEFNIQQSPARLAAALGAKLIQDSGSLRFRTDGPPPAGIRQRRTRASAAKWPVSIRTRRTSRSPL